jgi:hypothetical protein
MLLILVESSIEGSPFSPRANSSLNVAIASRRSRFRLVATLRLETLCRKNARGMHTVSACSTAAAVDAGKIRLPEVSKNPGVCGDPEESSTVPRTFGTRPASLFFRVIRIESAMGEVVDSVRMIFFALQRCTFSRLNDSLDDLKSNAVYTPYTEVLTRTSCQRRVARRMIC